MAWIPKGVSRVSADPFIPPPPARRPQTLSNNKPYQQYPRQPDIITANFSQGKIENIEPHRLN